MSLEVNTNDVRTLAATFANEFVELILREKHCMRVFIGVESLNTVETMQKKKNIPVFVCFHLARMCKNYFKIILKSNI